MRKTPLALILAFVLLLQSVPTPAFETDQYDLPPVPLSDIGDEVSRYVGSQIDAAVAKINDEIAKDEACLDHAAECGSAAKVTARIEYLRSGDAVAKEVAGRLAGGDLMFTKFGKWMTKHKFESQPSSYKTTYLRSIYVAAPADYVTISPTIRLYGIEFGQDKLEHLFQQGYKYYTVRRSELGRGKTDAEATKKAISWGQMTERTYYGLLVAGVYSNGDLFANYAGLKFYEGLTEDQKIGDATRTATLKLVNGKWSRNGADTDLLKPLISEHLNEAFNPSGYTIFLYSSVKRAVKANACPEWRARFPTYSAEGLDQQTHSLELWNGEDYGFTKRSRTVRVGDVCFGDTKEG